MKFVGLDIGTTTIGGVVFDPDEPSIVCSIVKNNNAAIHSENHWEQLQDPRVILETVSGILNSFCTNYPDIKGIGVTGQMHGIVYVDQSGNAVSPLYTWQDGRGNLPYKDGITYAGYLTAQTGHPMATGFGLTTHFYQSVHHRVPAEACSLCTIHDYVAMKLANLNQPVCDSTGAASLGLFNLENRQFDNGALVKLGIDRVLLPEIATSFKAIGETADGIQVFPALGDNQASFIGAVRDLDASFLVNVGTSSQVSVYTSQFAEISNLELRPFPGGGFLLVGVPLCGGKSYALLENFFKNTLKLFTKQEFVSLYDTMNQIDAEKLESNNLLKISTQFDGTRNDVTIRGSIHNIGLANFTPEYLIAGFLEGIAAELYELYTKFPASIRSKVRIMSGSGNGIRKNELLQQTFMKVFQMNMEISVREEEASLGAALSASTGYGCFQDIRSAMQAIHCQNG
jgi:Sugar (pentulose and hexulose) kinases